MTPRKRTASIVVLAAFLAAVAGSSQAEDEPVRLPKREHPFLFIDADGLAKARRRAEELPWAKRVRARLLRDAEGWLGRPIDIPDRGGQWSHHYVCKPCGVRLETASPTRHVCPACSKVYSGWPFDEVVVTRTHVQNLRAANRLALAHALSGDERFARKAAEILLGYAALYPKLPVHDRHGRPARRGGRLFAQTLDEAVHLIDVAWAYDLVCGSKALDEKQRSRIERDLLRPAAALIRGNDRGRSNWQSWHNAALGAIGFCLEDDALVRRAIEGRSGLRFQLGKSVLPDGFWYEGTASYHFYALRPLVRLGLMARAAGIDVLSAPPFKRLFDAPLALAMPDGRFPGINDGDRFPLASRAALYDTAYAVWKDPRHAAVARARARGLDALLFGATELPPGAVTAPGSVDLAGAGLAILRRGAPDQGYLLLDYGPHGGGHGHADKLQVVYAARGHLLAPDAGRLAYGAPLHSAYYKQTVAHNTIAIGKRSQWRTRGELTLFAPRGPAPAMRAVCRGAYLGARLVRTVVLLEDGYCDIVRVTAGPLARPIDWIHHGRGRLVIPPAAVRRTGRPGAAHGYQHVSLSAALTTTGGFVAGFEIAGGPSVRIVQAGAPGGAPTTALFCSAPGQPPTEPAPLVIARRKARATTFATFLEVRPPGPPGTPPGPLPSIRLLPATQDGRPADPARVTAFELTRGGRTEVFIIGPAGSEKKASGFSTTETVGRFFQP